jgi:hypothetical protein
LVQAGLGSLAAVCYDLLLMNDEDPEEIPERATPLLAVVRIVSVLGMSFGIAFGLFLLLGAWWLPALISFASAVPFFVVMRYVEKHTGADNAP